MTPPRLDDVLKWHEQWRGWKEGPNNANPFGQIVAKHVSWTVPAFWSNTPYCGIATMAAYLECGGDIPGDAIRSEYCPSAVAEWKKLGRWSEYPAKGAWVYFISKGVWYHVGTVVDFDADYIYTAEYNTFADGASGSGNGFHYKKHRRRDAYVGGYGLPAYGTQQPDQKPQQQPEDEDMGFLTQYSHGPDQPTSLWFLMSNDLTIKQPIEDEATLGFLKAAGVKVVPMSREQINGAKWGGMYGLPADQVGAAASNPMIDALLKKHKLI